MKWSFDAEAVLKYRKAQGMSQCALAWKVELTQTSVCFIETGKKQPRMQTLCRIAEALGVAPGVFFKKGKV